VRGRAPELIHTTHALVQSVVKGNATSYYYIMLIDYILTLLLQGARIFYPGPRLCSSSSANRDVGTTPKNRFHERNFIIVSIFA
jgi:hypothetical protein